MEFTNGGAIAMQPIPPSPDFRQCCCRVCTQHCRVNGESIPYAIEFTFLVQELRVDGSTRFRPKNLSQPEKNGPGIIWEGSKANFPYRTLNKISEFLAESSETQTANFVFLFEGTHKQSMLTNFHNFSSKNEILEKKSKFRFSQKVERNSK